MGHKRSSTGCAGQVSSGPRTDSFALAVSKKSRLAAARCRKYISITTLVRTAAEPRLQSAGDPVDSRLAFDAAQRRLELLDMVARQQLANSGRGVECFSETDFAGVGE